MSDTSTVDRIQRGNELERCPFPIPFGWYMVELSEDLKPGEIKNVQAFDQEWVMFRGEDGSVGMTDPYCPHLGAHLGKGGTVEGNNIRCPFHHWEYDAEGWCKKIPYGKVMPGIARRKAILRALPIQEKYGMIWCWYHPQEVEPLFDLPVVDEFERPDDYVPVRHGDWTMHTCMQEIGENGVDFAHLKFLHGSPMILPGSCSVDGYNFGFDIGEGYITGQNYGVGVQVVRHNKDGVSMLMFSTPLPITREETRSRMHFTFQDYEAGSKERELAEHLYQHSIGEADGEDPAGFESVDMIIWDNKKYRPEPLLCDGDGPILKWREWYSQFYVDDQPEQVQAVAAE